MRSDDNKWNKKIAKTIMEIGINTKFEQNGNLLKQLSDTALILGTKSWLNAIPITFFGHVKFIVSK